MTNELLALIPNILINGTILSNVAMDHLIILTPYVVVRAVSRLPHLLLLNRCWSIAHAGVSSIACLVSFTACNCIS